MRNVFDQYKQTENRLTHSLAVVLHEDTALLKSFLATFGPKPHPPVRELKVIEQSLSEIPELAGSETLRHGLPNALIFNDEGWALIIKSKINDAMARNQLERHRRSVVAWIGAGQSLLSKVVFDERCCMDRGGDGIRPFPSGSVR